VKPSRQSGAVLLVILLLVAITAVASASLIHLGATVARRQAEQTLLDIGQEFADALESYRRVSPVGSPDRPLALEDLLRDKRFPNTVRHLRKIYADPLTQGQPWGLVKDEESGRILGVFSNSPLAPIRSANFPGRMSSLAGKARYSDWEFSAMQSTRFGDSGNQRGSNALSPQDMNEPPPSQATTSVGTGKGVSPQDLIEP
jgi:hypothetical protein